MVDRKNFESENSIEKERLSNKIRYFRNERKLKQFRSRNLITVKRSDKIIEALSLPKVLSMNPRSIYNKLAEFVTFVKEEEVSLLPSMMLTI